MLCAHINTLLRQVKTPEGGGFLEFNDKDGFFFSDKKSSVYRIRDTAQKQLQRYLPLVLGKELAARHIKPSTLGSYASLKQLLEHREITEALTRHRGHYVTTQAEFQDKISPLLEQLKNDASSDPVTEAALWSQLELATQKFIETHGADIAASHLHNFHKKMDDQERTAFPLLTRKLGQLEQHARTALGKEQASLLLAMLEHTRNAIRATKRKKLATSSLKSSPGPEPCAKTSRVSPKAMAGKSIKEVLEYYQLALKPVPASGNCFYQAIELADGRRHNLRGELHALIGWHLRVNDSLDGGTPLSPETWDRFQAINALAAQAGIACSISELYRKYTIGSIQTPAGAIEDRHLWGEDTLLPLAAYCCQKPCVLFSFLPGQEWGIRYSLDKNGMRVSELPFDADTLILVFDGELNHWMYAKPDEQAASPL